MAELEELNKALMRRFAEALNQHDLDALDELVSPGFAPLRGDAWARYPQSGRLQELSDCGPGGVPDGRQTVRFLIAEGNLVAMYCTFSGTQTGQWGAISPTGRHVEFDFSGVVRFVSGRIAELWITWDNLTVLAQLGLAPPPAPA